MAGTLDISGKWTLNRALSDDTEEVLVLQNFGYLLRKAARYGTITLVFTHDTKGSPPTLEVTVIPPAGFAKESRTRKIDGERVEDKHFMFGTNYVTWRQKTKAEVEGYMAEEKWVGEELLEEFIEEGKGTFVNEGVCFLTAFVICVNKLTRLLSKIWGIIEEDGKKYLIKRAIVKATDGRTATARQVFEYAPLDA
jgi:hypothetical protein